MGAIVGLERLDVREVYSSPLRLGSGWVQSQHGKIPVPAPATVELVRGVPTHRTRIESELVTPTGAAIITTLARSFDSVPTFITNTIGYGAGSRRLEEIPNLLRVEIGQRQDIFLQDRSVVIETNIDDMNPEVYSHLMEKFLREGAQDVYLSQVIMKKGRPGILLSILVRPDSVHRLSSLILKETTTLGLRIYPVERLKARRESVTITTKYGPLQVKVAEINGEKRFTPEYDDCRKVAIEKNIPLLQVYEDLRKELSTLTDPSKP